MSYPITEVEEPKRPYRLWLAQEKRQISHRYFGDPKHAHMAALVEARWERVGYTIEVFNSANGRLLAQYTRRIDNIEIRGEHR